MDYAVGKPGRMIVLRLSEGDSLYPCVEEVARRENIQAATVLITGGVLK